MSVAAPPIDSNLIAANPDRGRVSARLLRRTAVVYAALCTLGTLPTLLGASPAWQAFGWGLWLPGGGFLAAGGWGWLGFTAAVGVFALGVMLWFVMGNLVAVPIAWLGAAALAAQHACTADERGRATLAVNLQRRTAVHVTPVN